MKYTYQTLIKNKVIDSVKQIETCEVFRVGDKYHMRIGDHTSEWRTIISIVKTNNEYIAFFNRGEKFGGGNRILLNNIKKAPGNYKPRRAAIKRNIEQNYQIF